MPTCVRFSFDDAVTAGETWGANCGPGALAAVCGLTLDDVRPHLDGFDAKRYTNPTMMFGALRSLGVQFSVAHAGNWPLYGLARVQWEGPWTAPGVPQRVRYRYTHWVGAQLDAAGEGWVFDINCICVGGWVSFAEWSDNVVPWLLTQVAPKNNGRWHLTHTVSMAQPAPAPTET